MAFSMSYSGTVSYGCPFLHGRQGNKIFPPGSLSVRFLLIKMESGYWMDGWQGQLHGPVAPTSLASASEGGTQTEALLL